VVKMTARQVIEKLLKGESHTYRAHLHDYFIDEFNKFKLENMIPANKKFLVTREIIDIKIELVNIKGE